MATLAIDIEHLLEDPHSASRLLAIGGADAVRQLSQAVSALRPQEHDSIVDAVLRQPWRESESLCNAVLEFVQELVSAVPAFVAVCVDALIRSFLPAKAAAAAIEADLSHLLLPRVHEALRGVLRACPLGIGCALRNEPVAAAHMVPLLA